MTEDIAAGLKQSASDYAIPLVSSAMMVRALAGVRETTRAANTGNMRGASAAYNAPTTAL